MNTQQNQTTETPETAAIQIIERRASDIARRAAEHRVTDQESYDTATNALKGLKAMIAEIKDTFGPIIKKAHDAHKEALAQQAKYLRPLEDADKILRRKSADWFAEQDRLRRAAEEAARKEAQRKAEEEALARASFLDEAGLKDEAERVLGQPVVPKAAPVTVTAPDRNGVVMRDVWCFEITDVTKLPREYMQPDEAAIRKQVQAMKGQANIPGVRVRCEKRAAVR